MPHAVAATQDGRLTHKPLVISYVFKVLAAVNLCRHDAVHILTTFKSIYQIVLTRQPCQYSGFDLR